MNKYIFFSTNATYHNVTVKDVKLFMFREELKMILGRTAFLFMIALTDFILNIVRPLDNKHVTSVAIKYL